MRVVCTDDVWWPLDRAAAIIEPTGATVSFEPEIAGDDVVGVLTYPGRRVDVDVLDRAPNIRVVATSSTGHDHIDAEGFAARGVWCCRVTHFCDQEVVDHTMALIYACLRGVVMLDRLVRSGTWWPYPRPPRPVRGAVLAVIGFGTIGRMLVEAASAAGMDVRVVSSHASADQVAAAGGRLASFEEALAAADVVSLMTSVSDETRGMFDAAALAQMRPDAYLVNTARAALVDHAALGAALETGAIAGCALDALPDEPASPDDPAFAWPHTILQPHSAWYSPEAALRLFDDAAEEVARVLRGERPRNVLLEPR